MSNHRINIIAALSAIALFAAPSLMAQTSAATDQSSQPTASSSSSATSSNSNQSSSRDARQSGDQSTSPDATSLTQPTATEAATSSPATSSPTLSESSPTTSIPSAATSAAYVGSSTRAEIKRADDTVEQSSAAKLKGQRVRDSNANELGKINDFIIDGGTGKIAHVVISTGGVLGVGDKLRLIPGANLKQSAGNDFTTDMSKADFEALPPISEKDLKAGRITAQPSTSSQTGEVTAMESTGQAVRASQLKDKSIRSDDHQVGEIEHVIIDLQKGEAMALIETNTGFAGESGKFLVPFSKLEVRSAESEHIGSSLLRSDFGSPLTSEATAATTSQSSPAAPLATTEPGASSTAVADSSTLSTSTTGVSTPTPTAPGSTNSSGDIATTSPSTAPSSTLATDTSSTSTESSTPLAQSSQSTRSVSDGAAVESRSDRSSSGATVASTPGATTTDAAVTGDTTRSTGLADTANAPSDPSNTSSSVVTSATSRGPGDEQLAPTGLTSAEQSPASGATAMAIRQALDSDATLAREDVQVTTKIVLHGTVKSEEAKSRIEELAKKAAQNAEIDNQITVQPK